jgi:hypothetical protein
MRSSLLYRHPAPLGEYQLIDCRLKRLNSPQSDHASTVAHRKLYGPVYNFIDRPFFCKAGHSGLAAPDLKQLRVSLDLSGCHATQAVLHPVQERSPLRGLIRDRDVHAPADVARHRTNEGAGCIGWQACGVGIELPSVIALLEEIPFHIGNVERVHKSGTFPNVASNARDGLVAGEISDHGDNQILAFEIADDSEVVF